MGRNLTMFERSGIKNGKTKSKADRRAKKGNFIAQYFG